MANPSRQIICHNGRNREEVLPNINMLRVDWAGVIMNE